MKYEELIKLENGTFLVIRGVDFRGEKYYRAITFHKEWVIDKGYLFGGTLYPFEWFYLPTDKDYQKEIKRLTDNYNNALMRLKEAYEQAQRLGGK